MNRIAIINKNNKIKYYIPCLIPLIMNTILKEGSPIYLSLLANQGLQAVPNYCIDNEGTVFSNVIYSWKLRHVSILDMLKIHIEHKHFTTYEEGIEYIRKQIKIGKEVIVGVTTYYLPYSANYMNDLYINNYPDPLLGIINHAVLITDIVDEKIKIYDTTPQIYHEWIDIRDFKLAWMTDKEIKQLKKVDGIDKLQAYSYDKIVVSEPYSEKKVYAVSVQLLHTIIQEYFQSKVLYEGNKRYFYGSLANEKIIHDLKQGIIKRDSEYLKSMILWAVEQKICRYFFRDLYEDISILLPNKYNSNLNEVKDNVCELEKLFMKLVLESSRKTIRYEVLKDLVTNLENQYVKERELLQRIYKLCNHLDTLPLYP